MHCFSQAAWAHSSFKRDRIARSLASASTFFHSRGRNFFASTEHIEDHPLCVRSRIAEGPYDAFGGNRMARRSALPPKPKSPILTVGQKRHRIERLQKCITRLEAFDPQKARKRAPAVLEIEAGIDKALSSAFGYGTPTYLRYNQAATLDPSPLLADVAVRAPARPIGGTVRHEAKVQETRQQFSENKERSIALLRKAISTLEDEIAKAGPVVAAKEAVQDTKATLTAVEVRMPRRWGSIALEAAWRRARRWWQGRNR
jgi:hypothetical protein